MTPNPDLAIARVEVSAEGVQQITGADLQAAGVDLEQLHADDLALAEGSTSIPIHVTAGVDGSVDAETMIDFVARDVATLYSPVAAYTVYADPDVATRIGTGPVPGTGGEAASAATTVETDMNVRYSVSAPGDDPWYWNRIVAINRPAQKLLPVTVTDLAPGPAHVEVELWGLTHTAFTDEHHVVVELNGAVVADTHFDGQERLVLSIDLSDGALVEGANSLIVRAMGDAGPAIDIIAVDRWSVTYQRSLTTVANQLAVVGDGSDLSIDPTVDAVYRTAPAGDVKRLPIIAGVVDGGAPGAVIDVVAAGGAHRPVVSAAPDIEPLPTAATDYLIVTHPDLARSIQPLVAYHQGRGLTVRVVDVTAIYAQYGLGVPDAGAIDRYLADAIPALGVQYVLLAGGDTYDYHDVDGDGSVSHIPSPYGATGQGITYAPLDPAYADVDGDHVPDVALGRLPVSSAAELDALVQKSITFAQLAATRPRTAVLASDVSDEMSYVDVNDRLAAHLQDWTVARADLETVGVSQARTTLFAEVNAGAALTSFVGHSGSREWTYDGLFSTADLASLTNSQAPTAVTQFGCWNSYYVRDDGLGTGLLTAEGGAALSFGAATLTSAHNEVQFAELFYAQLGQPGVTAGAAMQAAKRALAGTSPTAADILLGWTLLGDPALPLAG